jgi:signal peptidase I
MATSKLRQLWKKDYVQTIIMIVLILAIVVGLWFGTQVVLGTPYPALAVASGSMCEVQGMSCDGWSHPFERTLHTGDLIIVQGPDPNQLKTGLKPEGDIIIFHKPQSSQAQPDELIVHRAIEKTTHNGLTYFRTWGDGNGSPDSWVDYRGENYTWDGKISEKLLVGKVALRIPWVGHLALFMRNSSGIYVIMAIIILLVIMELAVPSLKGKKPEIESAPGENAEPTSET